MFSPSRCAATAHSGRHYRGVASDPPQPAEKKEGVYILCRQVSRIPVVGMHDLQVDGHPTPPLHGGSWWQSNFWNLRHLRFVAISALVSCRSERAWIEM